MVRPLAVAPPALVLALGAVAGSAGCGDGPRRIALEPVPLAEPACGRPAGGTGLIVTGLGAGAAQPRSIDLGAGGEVVLDDLAPGTRQLMVEVLGEGGETVALGRTAPLALDDLADGDVVRVLMAPPDGACDVAALASPRAGPAVVAAGDGALVIGGGPGQPLAAAAFYDPAAGRFTEVALPPAFTGPLGTAGAVVVALPDGRAVIVGGDRPGYAVFDPATRAFVDDGAIFEIRAHHAAVALGGARVAIAGGCGALDRDTGACVAGTERRDTFVLDVDTGEVTYGPTLARERLGAALIAEPGLDGAPARAVAIGGVDGAGAVVDDAERYDPAGDPLDGAVVTIPGAGGVATTLASGATVVAFPGGAAGAVAIVPGVDVARPLASGGVVASGGAVSLEDGSALWLGAASGGAVRLAPATGRFAAVPAWTAGWSGQGAARLPDGTVLVAGGTEDGEATARAAVLRPAGEGPFTGAVTITPGAGGELPLVPLDPALVDVSPELTVSSAASAALASWLIVGGLRADEVEVSATVRVTGGVALLLGFVDAGRFDAIELAPGAPARLVRRDAAAPVARCSGAEVEPGALGGAAVTITARARGDGLEVEIGGRVVLACDGLDWRDGHVGIAPWGADAAVTLLTMAVAR